MEDGVDAEAGAGDGGSVGEVGIEEVDLFWDVGEVAGGEVVEAADFYSLATGVVAALDEGVGEVGADEASDAGDEVGGQIL